MNRSIYSTKREIGLPRLISNHRLALLEEKRKEHKELKEAIRKAKK